MSSLAPADHEKPLLQNQQDHQAVSRSQQVQQVAFIFKIFRLRLGFRPGVILYRGKLLDLPVLLLPLLENGILMTLILNLVVIQ